MDTLTLDTIWINGSSLLDTLGAPDEWDDILLHEFGQYVMDYYSRKPRSNTGGHAWSFSYPERPDFAYSDFLILSTPLRFEHGLVNSLRFSSIK